MEQKKGKKLRKKEAIKPARLMKPRITPLNKKEARRINKKLLDRSEWKRMFKLLENNPVNKALFALNVYSTLMRNQDITMRVMMMFRQLSSKMTISERERELLVLRTAWLCYSEYEWGNHLLLGKQAGLTDQEINNIKIGFTAEEWNSSDALLLKIVDELYFDNFITDDTWMALNEKYDFEQIMDIIFLVGQYNLLAMFLNSTGVQLEYNKKGFEEE
ncbi:MAG: hypothetical protein GF317_08465 [Candidatus Lokiarchaeota archaeon]|nr:hypothetical protein [Candidatus Lokiarchaeota archaeon]MBD3199747.1 hypothetical protein [Candidatus Lokiarchaeota archaeon]